MDRFAAMQIFVRIVETGSLSATARELDTTQPTISKQLTALEAHLRARLLHRSTRKLTLTEAGAAYYERCKRILDDVREAEGTLGQLQSTLSGHLHINAPIAFGERFLNHLVLRFQGLYPALSVELTLNDRFIDLVEDGIDLAIRIGKLPDSTLVARRLGASRRVAVATPAYLRERGRPQHPQDLVHHNCLLYSYLSTGNEWRFAGGDGEIRVRVAGTFKSNNGKALSQAVLAGAGIAIAPEWLVLDKLEDGVLEAILTEYEPPPAEINAVYASSRLLSAKVRACIDFLQESFRDVPELNPAAPVPVKLALAAGAG